MKEKKTKKHIKLRIPKLTPLNLIILIVGIVLLFFIIAIPVVYVKEYNANKVIPFESDLKGLSSSDYVSGNKDIIEDFNFVLWCQSYNNETGSISFRVMAYENEYTRDRINIANKISVKLGMFSNWINVNKSTSSYSRLIAPGPSTALSSSRYYADYIIAGIPTLPSKGNLPFVNIKEIPVYAYVTYETIINGTIKEKHYLLKYEYEDYVIESKTLEDYRDKEVQVSSSSTPYFQWRYKNDTSWTNLCSVDSIIGVEIRAAEGYIQWKRKCDDVWTNYIPFSELSGYEEGLVPQVQVTSNTIQWKWPDDENYQTTMPNGYSNSITLLKQPDYQVTDTHIQWKRKNQTEYQDFIALSELEGYEEGRSVILRISGSNLEWRLDNESTYKVLTSIDGLMGVQIEKDASGDILYKCVDETEWKNLYLNGKKVTTSNLESTPATIGPTAGGI